MSMSAFRILDDPNANEGAKAAAKDVIQYNAEIIEMADSDALAAVERLKNRWKDIQPVLYNFKNKILTRERFNALLAFRRSYGFRD